MMTMLCVKLIHWFAIRSIYELRSSVEEREYLGPVDKRRCLPTEHTALTGIAAWAASESVCGRADSTRLMSTCYTAHAYSKIFAQEHAL
jgi:hypothetical protein